jgi:hypothetical protein
LRGRSLVESRPGEGIDAIERVVTDRTTGTTELGVVVAAATTLRAIRGVCK